MAPGQISSWMQWMMMLSFTLPPRYESGRFTYLGLGSGLGHIIRTEGLTGLFRGLVPTLVRWYNSPWFFTAVVEVCLLHRDVPFSALYLASYEMLKKEIPSRVNTSSSTCHIMAGLGKQFAVVLIKTRTRGLGVPIIFMSWWLWEYKWFYRSRILGQFGHTSSRCGEDTHASEYT